MHEPAHPAPGPAFRPGFIALLHDHYCTAHNLLQAAFYGSISASPLLAASKYGALRSWLGAVPVRCSLRCCSGFAFGSKSFTNQVKSQHHCRERREASTVTDGGLGVGFLVVVGGCRESLLGEQWNVAVVTHIQHMQTKWSEATSRKKLSRQGTHASRAACTIDDLVDGCKRALSMTSSMDAQREGNI